MDFPQIRYPPLNVITPFHIEAGGYRLRVGQQGIDTIATLAVVSNTAYYYPFRLYEPSIAVKMSVMSGAAVSGNFDIGIYDSEKNRLVNSGSTALVGTTTLQVADITDTTLLPGIYFMAVQFSASTNAAGVSPASADEFSLSAFPIYDEAVGSFGLPATAGLALSTSATPLILAMGVHFNATV